MIDAVIITLLIFKFYGYLGNSPYTFYKTAGSF